MEAIVYLLDHMDGDYALLVSGGVENPVARALLPADADEGSYLLYENLSYSLCDEKGVPF